MMRKELHRILDTIPSVQHRVYPLIMPQDTKKASIVYRMIGTANLRSISCSDPLDATHYFMLEIFAPSYGEAVDIAEAAEAVLRKELLTFDLYRYDDYADHTLRYKQVIEGRAKLKPVYAPPVPPVTTNAVHNGSALVMNGNSIIVN
jgi:hypothetical protein